MTSPWANGNEAEQTEIDRENAFRNEVLIALGKAVNPRDFNNARELAGYVNCLIFSAAYTTVLNEADVLINRGVLPADKKYEYSTERVQEHFQDFIDMMETHNGRP